MRCLYCGESLSLFRKLKGLGEFCSEAHRDAYQQEFNSLALGRLRQTRSNATATAAAERPAPLVSPPIDEPTPEPRTAVAVAEPPAPPEAPYLTMRANSALVETDFEIPAFPPAHPSGIALRLPLNGIQPPQVFLRDIGECEFITPAKEVPLESLRNPLREAIAFPGDDIHLWMAPLSLNSACELGEAHPAALEFEASVRTFRMELKPIAARPLETPPGEIQPWNQALAFEPEAQGPAMWSEWDFDPRWEPRPVCDPVVLDLEASIGWTQSIETKLDFEDRRFEFVFRPVELPEWVQELKSAPAEPEEKPENTAASRPRRIISARPRTASVEAPRESSEAGGSSGNGQGGGLAIPPGFVAVPYSGPMVAAPMGSAPGNPLGSAPTSPASGASGASGFVAPGFVQVPGFVPAPGFVQAPGFVPSGFAGAAPAGAVPFVTTAQSGPLGQAPSPESGAEPPPPNVFHMPAAGGSTESSAGPMMVSPTIVSGNTGPLVAGFAAAIPVVEGLAGGRPTTQGFTMGTAATPQKGVGVTVNTTVLVDGAEGSISVQSGTKISTNGRDPEAKDKDKSEDAEKDAKSSSAKSDDPEKRKVVAPASFLVPNREPLNERTLRLNPKPLLQAAMPVETPHLDTQPMRRPIAFGPARTSPAPSSGETTRSSDTLRAAAAKSLPPESGPSRTEPAKAKERELFRNRVEEADAKPSGSSRNLKLAVILLVVTALIAFAFWKFTAKSAVAFPKPGTGTNAPVTASISDSFMKKGIQL